MKSRSLLILILVALVFSTYGSVNVKNANAAACSIDFFNPSQNPVTRNNSTTVSWSTSNCSSVSLYTGNSLTPVAQGDFGGYDTGPLSSNTDFTLNADGQTQTFTITVVVGPSCQMQYFTSNTSTIAPGGTASLSWDTANCSQVTLTPPGSTVSPTDSAYPVSPTSTTTYTLRDENGDTQTQTITVSSGSQCSIGTFSASPNPVNWPDYSTTFTWTTNNCGGSSVTLGPDTQISNPTVAPNGNQTVTVSQNGDTTYRLNAGQTSQTLTIHVPSGCAITDFSNTVDASNNVTLTWSRGVCTNFHVYGGSIDQTFTNANQNTYSVNAGTITQQTTYTLEAFSQQNSATPRQTTALPTGSPPNITCSVTVNRIANPAGVNTIVPDTGASWNVYQAFNNQSLSSGNTNTTVSVSVPAGTEIDVAPTSGGPFGTHTLTNYGGSNDARICNSSNTSFTLTPKYKTRAELNVQ